MEEDGSLRRFVGLDPFARLLPAGCDSSHPQIVFVTLHEQVRILDCGVHVLQSEVIVLLETLEASPEQAPHRLHPYVLAAPEADCAKTVPQLLCAEPDRTNGLFIKKALQCQTAERKTGTSNRSIALSIGVDADARRISQALTEPEYLEAWISMPNVAEDSRIVASKREDGYRLDQVRAGRAIASFVAHSSFVTSARCACHGATQRPRK